MTEEVKVTVSPTFDQELQPRAKPTEDVKIAVSPTFDEPTTTPKPTNDDSVIVRIKAARGESSGKLSFIKSFTTILFGTVAFTVMVAFSLAIPISMIVMGAIHLDDCRAERYIPIYLLVMGCFASFKTIISLIQRVMMHKKDDPEEDGEEEKKSKCVVVDAILGCFMMAWFIAGNVWIYGLFGNYDGSDVTAPNYCDETLYLFAFWMTTVAYILAILTCCCCSVGCIVVMCFACSQDD